MSTLQTAKTFLNEISGHTFKIKIRRANGGIGKEKEQVIVTGSGPKGPVTYRGKETTFTDAYTSACVDIFRATNGVSTFFVSRSEWLDMFKMNYSEIENLKSLNLKSKIEEANNSHGRIADSDKSLVLISIEKALKDNDLNPGIASLDNAPTSENKIHVGFRVKDLKEDSDEIKKVNLLVEKINKEFKGIISAYMNYEIVRDTKKEKTSISFA